MFIEFQLSTQLFGRIVRNRIMGLDLCLDNEDHGTVVDRIVPRASSNSTIVQRETKLSTGAVRTEEAASTQLVWVFSPKNYFNFTTRHLQVVQEFDVFLVSASDLETNGVNPTESQPITVRVAFNVSLKASNQTQGGGPASLVYEFAWAHFGILDAFMPSSERSRLESLISGIALVPTTIDLTPLKEVTGTAMQAINAGMALGADGACVAMRIDFEVFETPPAVTQEFFEQGPQDVLFGQEWAMLLDKELLISTARQKVQEGLEGKSKVKLLWGPEVQWEPATPKLVVNSGVKILDACPFFVSNIDLKVELQAEMTFAVAAPNELHLKFHLDAWASDIGQIIGCAVVPSLFWPIAGPIVLNELKSNSVVGDYFAGLLLGLPMICSQIASAIAPLGVKEVSAESFGPHCVKTTDSDVDCTYPLSFNAGAVFPISMRDASVHGTVAGLVLCGPSQLRDLQEEIITVTTSPLEWTLTGGCRSGFGMVDQAQIPVASTGRRGGLCSARSLDDPLNEFTVTVDRAENMVTVRAKASPAYAALDPKYQCKVRVVTTGGVRTITYPAPEPITAECKQELERFEHNFNQVCQAWKDTFVKIEWGGWGPPMPVDRPDWLQYWEVAIHDLRGDEQVDVVTEAGVAVLEARASVNGVAHLGAIFRGRTGPAAILIGRRGGGPYQKAPTITAVQMILEHRMSIPTEGSSVVMRFRGPDADRQLLIVDAVKERIFALGSRTVGPVVRSVARSISTKSNRKEYPEERVKETFSLVTLEALNQIEMREGPAITIADPRVGGVARPLFVRTKVRGALYDIVEGQEPRVAQIYAGNAWFEQIALGGSWVARLNNEGSAVDLYFAISRRLDVDISRSTTA